jgi:elongation factor P
LADTSDFRNGLIMRMAGQLYAIVEFQHVKPGKGGAFVRTKLKKIPEGAVVDKTFRAGEKIDQVRVERHTYQYLYRNDDLYYVMDLETYDQLDCAEIPPRVDPSRQNSRRGRQSRSLCSSSRAMSSR